MLRIVMHVDLDAFFAACEVRERPELKGKPVVVGADPKHGRGRGVISTCSYEARKYGLHSGMPISIAWHKCPSPPCVYLPVNFELYIAVSEKVMEILRRNADSFEQGGIDEAYIDVSSAGSYEKALEIAKKIQAEVEQKQQVTCSVGIAPNKLVAKIASDFKKPKGVTAIKPRQVSRFLAPMDVIKLPGIGPKTSARLHEIEIEKIRDLRRFKKSQLSELFGKFGSDVYDMCRGKDNSPVEERTGVKSIGRQVTFESDTRDRGLIYEAIEQMSRETREQLVTMNMLYQTVTVTVRYRGFETHTKAKSLEAPTDSLEAIIDTAKELVKSFFDDPRTIRLVGVRVSKLVGH